MKFSKDAVPTRSGQYWILIGHNPVPVVVQVKMPGGYVRLNGILISVIHDVKAWGEELQAPTVELESYNELK